MPLHIHWDDESHNLLRVTFEGTWALEDLLMTGVAAIDEVSTTQNRVDVILDFSRSASRIPQNLPILIPQLKDKALPANRGIILLIDAPMSIRTFVSMLQGIAPDMVADLYFMDSLREAYLLLEKPVRDAETLYPVSG